MVLYVLNVVSVICSVMRIRLLFILIWIGTHTTNMKQVTFYKYLTLFVSIRTLQLLCCILYYITIYTAKRTVDTLLFVFAM